MSALLVYAVWGTPMPNTIGINVYVTGSLLIVAAGAAHSAGVLSGYFLVPKISRETFLTYIANLAFIYFLIVGTFLGFFRGNTVIDVVRDILPLCFLFLPLFLSKISRLSSYRKSLVFNYGLAICGLIMSVRFMNIAVTDFSAIGSRLMGFDGYLLLASEPSILFAAIFIPLSCISKIRAFTPKALVLGVIGISAAIICFITFSSKLARGPIALTFLAYTIFIAKSKTPIQYKILFLLLFFAVAAWYFDYVVAVLDLLLEKNARVGGASAKLIELQYVWAEATQSVWRLLFGGGWGELINVRQGASFSFTHSLPTYFLAKSGLVGLLFLLLYLLSFLRYWILIYRNDFALFLALLFSLMYPMFFQPTYKVLTFGMLLFSVSFSGAAFARNYEKKSAFRNQKESIDTLEAVAT